MIKLKDITPLRDFVLLKEHLVKEKGGIILTQAEDTPYTVAEVVKTGPDAGNFTGKVMIKRYMFEEMQEKDEVYFIGPQEGIIAKV